MTERILTLPMKGVYFNQILAGEKPCEYRLANSYWTKRILNRVYDKLVLTLGYPSGGGVEGVTRMTMPYLGAWLEKLQHPHFGPDPVDVFSLPVDQYENETESFLNVECPVCKHLNDMPYECLRYEWQDLDCDNCDLPLRYRGESGQDKYGDYVRYRTQIRPTIK